MRCQERLTSVCLLTAKRFIVGVVGVCLFFFSSQGQQINPSEMQHKFIKAGQRSHFRLNINQIHSYFAENPKIYRDLSSFCTVCYLTVKVKVE